MILALCVFACSSAASATALGDDDTAARPSDMMPADTIAPARASPPFEASDPALPVGKSVALPTPCVAADREASGAIEQQGERLDADPTLFAESFATLIRARIACRAGRVSDALNLYDEIRESLREKAVPDELAHRAD
jgi:pentatricopeptide repeat protein